jgi:predicted nucleic acid-binding Zn ribbon protein
VSDLERIGDGLEAVLRRLGLPAVDVLQRLVSDWTELTGEPWASRARPAGLQRGELVVEVADGTSASLLRYQTEELLRRLEEGLGARLVNTVRIRLAGPKKGS